jgi:hypothetical protein
MSTIMDIFERISKSRGWATTEDTPAETKAEKDDEKRIWNEVMKQLHEPFQILSAAMDQGLEHAGIVLEILPRPRVTKSDKQKESDVEQQKDAVARPGSAGFSEQMEGKVQMFHSRRSHILHTWAKEVGLVPDEDGEGIIPPDPKFTSSDYSQSHRAQLYILLYMVKLVRSIRSRIGTKTLTSRRCTAHPRPSNILSPLPTVN